jgi:VanZ family protein
MKFRTLWLATGWLWIAVVFYLSLMRHPPEPLSFENADKLEHMLAYCWLMLWFCQLAGLSRLRLAVALVAMGAGIEVLQRMEGFRHFEYADMLADAAGVLLGWMLARTRLGRVLNFLEGYGR